MKDHAKIMIVDDDIDVIEQLTLMLEATGYEVTSAEAQSEAEKLLENYEPDVAVVDLMMENMDSGFVLAHHIKRRYPKTGVIMLTAVASETGLGFDVTTNGERSWVKADVLLDKPVRHEQLRAEIERLLQD